MTIAHTLARVGLVTVLIAASSGVLSAQEENPASPDHVAIAEFFAELEAFIAERPSADVSDPTALAAWEARVAEYGAARGANMAAGLNSAGGVALGSFLPSGQEFYESLVRRAEDLRTRLQSGSVRVTGFSLSLAPPFLDVQFEFVDQPD